MRAHNDIFRDLDHFRIPEARPFKSDTNVVISVTFDITSGFC